MLNTFKKVICDFVSGETLKARATKGGMWLGIGSGTEQLLRLLRNMILTRLLAPDAFGAMAIIIAVNTFFQSFTEIGIREAVIQNPNGNEITFLNGAWWFSFGRVIVLYTIAYFGAPLIVNFYNNPELLPMMRIAFLSLVFRGMMSTKAYVLVKELNFKRWILIEQTGGVIGILTTIFLAFKISNVWALVIGFTVESLMMMILSYVMCPMIPRFKFNKVYIQSLFKFTRGMLGLPILAFIPMKIDVFIIGKLLTKTDLGLYSMAASLARLPSLFMSKFVAPLLMPAFSEMQNDNKRINGAIINVNTALAFIGIPLITFVALFGESILSVIYTPRYAQVAIPFAILFSAIMIRNFSVPIAAVYLAFGRPSLLRYYNLFRAIFIAIIIYPAIKKLGLEGAALSVLITMISVYFFQVFKLKKLTGLKVLKYWYSFIYPVLFSTPIIMICIMTNYINMENATAKLLFGVGGVLVTYILSISFFKKLKIMNKKGNTHTVQ